MSGRVYDLDSPGRVRAVLTEAATPEDLYAYLDEKLLGRLWALPWLPAQLRRAWEWPLTKSRRKSEVTARAADGRLPD